MRKFIIIIAIIAASITALCMIDYRRLDLSQPTETATNSDEPEFVDPEKLWIDTIMYAGGHSFGYSGDVSMWDGWYFDTIPVGNDFMLECDSAGPSTLHLNLVTKEINVDLSHPDACDRIKAFLGPIKGFKRFEQECEVCIDSVIDEEYGVVKSIGRFSFAADYADSCIDNSDKINQLVCKLATSSSNINVDVPALTSLYIGYNKRNYSSKEYSGTPDMRNLSDFILAETLAAWRQMEDLPYIGGMGSDLALKIHIINPEFVTFGVYKYDREGTGHGMYTETFHSFDIESGQELDNDDIFKPGTLGNVRTILYGVMSKNERYTSSYQGVETAEDVRERIDGWRKPCPVLEGTEFEESEREEIPLPQAALTNTGLVFSFQPYEIDCWAAGAYHFIVPYKRLMPYLTSETKRLISGGNLK